MAMPWECPGVARTLLVPRRHARGAQGLQAEGTRGAQAFGPAHVGVCGPLPPSRGSQSTRKVLSHHDGPVACTAPPTCSLRGHISSLSTSDGAGDGQAGLPQRADGRTELLAPAAAKRRGGRPGHRRPTTDTGGHGARPGRRTRAVLHLHPPALQAPRRAPLRPRVPLLGHGALGVRPECPGGCGAASGHAVGERPHRGPFRRPLLRGCRRELDDEDVAQLCGLCNFDGPSSIPGDEGRRNEQGFVRPPQDTV
mmetsp:Transcript_98218/g.305793  ORF Transcript_98218/g.305793 Transcript_98218/m.305793 type:complete len:253 (-) Transcript_98218:971-1729(-)